MKNKKRTYKIIIILLCVVFFFVYAYTSIFAWLGQYIQTGHIVFNWPDANANYFFARLFADYGNLSWYEPLNLLTDNLLHTRSINVVSGSLVPIGFLPPIIIFGLFVKAFGSIGLLFLTPFLAALSGYIIYRLSYYIFGDLDISFWIAMLFLSLAPWIFFANVVMLPTILFIFLVLSGWLAIVKSFYSPWNFWWILGSLLLSLAVVVRPTEIVWLSLITLFVLYIKRDFLDLRKVLYGSLIFLFVILAFLSFNKITYGGFFSLGYFNLQSGQIDSEIKNNPFAFWQSIRLLLAPFGFDFLLLVKNFYRYFVEIALIQFLLAISGAVFLLTKKKIDFVWKKYLILTPFIFLLILVYYGSWSLADPLVKELNKISISYVRYFLPLFVWILPLSALALKEIFFKQKKLRYLFPVLIVLIFIISFKIAFYSSNDGLVKNKQTINNYFFQYREISAIALRGSVIITDRSDKIFFPEYKVVAPQYDLPLWPRIKNIIDIAPVYYYTAKSSDEILVDRQKANQVNLDLVEIGQIWDNFILYKVKKIN